MECCRLLTIHSQKLPYYSRLFNQSREIQTLQDIGFSSLEVLHFKERILDIEKATLDLLIEGIEHRGPWKIPAVDRTRVFSV